MRRIEKYCCELCGVEFYTEEECREHEATHRTDWGNADNKKIAKELRRISFNAGNYRIGETVFDYFLKDFETLMDEAAKRIEGGR